MSIERTLEDQAALERDMLRIRCSRLQKAIRADWVDLCAIRILCQELDEPERTMALNLCDGRTGALEIILKEGEA